MTTPVDIRSIDIASLTTVPQLAVTGYVSLIKSLTEVAPAALLIPIKRAFDRMQATRAQAEQAIVARLGDDVDLALERSFDLLVDRLWLSVRTGLEFWTIYHHDGIALFGPEQRAELDIDECRELAAVAEDLHARLFGGPDAADFLRLPYAQQATHMAGRLQLIKEKGLDATLEELVGARTVKMLKIGQQRYEAMVNARGARANAVVGNLREQRTDLHRAIQLYALSVASMLDDEVPDSPAIVQRALLPLLVARIGRASGGAEVEVADELAGDTPDPAAAPEPEAEGA